MRELNYNGVNLQVFGNKEEMSAFTVSIMLERMKSPDPVNIMLPTGTTPELVYEELARQEASIFEGVRLFNMDEYGFFQNNEFRFVDCDDEASYKRYMKENVLKNIWAKVENYFPSEKDALKAGSYDQLIQEKWWIDLCVNAIGEDGHTFWFNSPPNSETNSQTRLVELNTSTQNVNKGLTWIETPSHAVTIWLDTWMRSKEILLLVCWVRKARILKDILDSDWFTREIPATILKEHPNCSWIIDEDAARLLK